MFGRQKEETESRPTWVELPEGILTADGVWYHTKEEDLRSFAPEVIEHYGISVLLGRSDSWVKLPTTTTLFALLLFLLVVPPWLAAVYALAVFLLLSLMSPFVVFFGLIPTVSRLNHPIAQGLVYIAVLSYLAASTQMAALAVGLIGFVILRLQFLARMISPLSVRFYKSMSPLSAPDLILRNVLIRASLKHGYDAGGLAKMQERMLDIMNYRKKSAK